MIERYPFIFSNEFKYRVGRHLVFWLTWCVIQAFLYSFISIKNIQLYSLCLESALLEAFVYLVPHVFFSYSLMYFVIPRFVLKQKYLAAACWVIIAGILTALISAALSLTVIEAIQVAILGRSYTSDPQHTTVMIIFLSFMAGLRGGLTIAGIASAIKLMKYWYIKEQRNLQLQKENIASQLQLLKAQVHPHFLFNTLNNIYSYTQKVSSTASTLVMGLSDLMRYILHEGSHQAVPLSRELKMINDYIALEQVRYGNSLDINKDLPSNTDHFQIAPLLLLPFVENCFKHGASGMLEQPWIRLAIQLDGNKLKMTLVNAKYPGPVNKEPASGIGITNVKKRLELLYPGKHQLTITAEDDVYIVNLVVELEKMSTVTISKEVKELSYA